MKLRPENLTAIHSSADEHERIDSLLFYVSTWVTCTGAQRMQNFYFFLAFQAGLAAFLGTQYNKPGTNVSLMIIGCLGVISSLAFAMLEIRNTELIMSGKRALEEIEDWLRTSLGSSQQFLKVMDSTPQSIDSRRACLRRAIWEFPFQKDHEFTGRASHISQYIIRHAFVYRCMITVSLVAWAIFIWYTAGAYHPA